MQWVCPSQPHTGKQASHRRAGVVSERYCGLGAARTALRGALQDPASLLRPLAGALGGLAGGLDPGGLPLSEYAGAVREGVTVLGDVLAGLDDPAQLGKGLGLPLGDALGSV